MSSLYSIRNFAPPLCGLAALTFCTLLLTTGCTKLSNSPEVVVYAALDREFSEPILDDFEMQTGIRVRKKFDTESTKTVGLTSQLIAESRGRTRCDVFWNNEILNTLRLDELDLLKPTQPKNLERFPEAYRSTENRWFGFAARARVLIVNSDLVADAEMPDSIYSLLDPKWKGRIGMAKPLFGTTATHAVCLFTALGDAKAKMFFDALLENQVQIVSGNKQVAEDVAAGRLAFGLTDTDDAIIELESGFPVSIVYPDSQPHQMGTLFIPNTICILRDSPNAKAAKQLVDYLLCSEVEWRLAEGKSAQIPLSLTSNDQDHPLRGRIETPATVHAMPVNFAQSVGRWSAVSVYLKNKFAEK